MAAASCFSVALLTLAAAAARAAPASTLTRKHLLSITSSFAVAYAHGEARSDCGRGFFGQARSGGSVGGGPPTYMTSILRYPGFV